MSFVPFEAGRNKDLSTKRFEKMMDALHDLNVAHNINISSEVKSSDGVVRWGIWVLVVVNMASLGLFAYLSFFHG